jgi:phage host-nuclease inhibitor protein Gam
MLTEDTTIKKEVRGQLPAEHADGAELPQDLGLDQVVAVLPAVHRDVYEALLASGYLPTEALQLVQEHVHDLPKEERFSVHDLSSANWVMKKLAEIDDDLTAVQAMIDVELAAIARRGEAILKPLLRSREFFEKAYGPQLRAFAEQDLQGKKARSLKLVHGTCGFRKNPDSLVIEDEEKLIAILKTRELFDLIRFKEEVRKKELKAYLTDNKQVMRTEDVEAPEYRDDDGKVLAIIQPGEETFYIKPAQPEA